ncbi:alpha/beta fold hydrolase [Methylocystis iwaonis]|uniref:alpha/beta fold hydrolase n=1 Tax=Methylocystis iwaonis TaxID=2885079 RepID=UPI0025789040|nr:alpha/beta fold hydrolase [Methylocystis iwaonis]
MATETTVFAYNRPGIGASAPATTPRDGVTVVEELRATLRAKGIAPPYVLVGHSIGGLYVQLYARRHPNEVAGLGRFDSSRAVERRWRARKMAGMGQACHRPGVSRSRASRARRPAGDRRGAPRPAAVHRQAGDGPEREHADDRNLRTRS